MRQQRRLSLKQSKFRLNGQAPAAAAGESAEGRPSAGRGRMDGRADADARARAVLKLNNFPTLNNVQVKCRLPLAT